MKKVAFLFVCGLIMTDVAVADNAPNEDEDKVPAYVLPDPLVMQDGTRVNSAEQWRDGTTA